LSAVTQPPTEGPAAGEPAPAPRAGRDEQKEKHRAGSPVDPDDAASEDPYGIDALRLDDLDRFDHLTDEQLAAIHRSMADLSKQINGRLQQQLRDLDRQIAAAQQGLAAMPELRKEDFERLNHDMAKLSEHLKMDPRALARLDAELKRLAAE